MSHLTQMAGLTVQNFVSAAVGISVAIAFVRGLVRRQSETIGNFWVDLVRTTTRVLLPLAFVVALLLVSQGVVQTLRGPATAQTLEGATQEIYRAPVASQEAIKELGTNGGGIANANSAHPFENPTGVHQLRRDAGDPADPVRAHLRVRPDGGQPAAGLGALRGDVRAVARLGRDRDGLRSRRQPADRSAAGSTGEGKEVRFGAPASALFAATTTGTSTGAVISSHDSFTPGGGAVPLVNMMLGEVSPGGVGAGLYGMLVFALLAVFLAGPDGRADAGVPRQEDPGRGDEARRRSTSWSCPRSCSASPPRRCCSTSAKASILNPGPHGLSRGRLRLHLRGEQQRLGLRRPDRQHRLVQHDARPGDARRPVPADRDRARARRLARTQADRPGDCGHLPDRDAALHRAARRASC